MHVESINGCDEKVEEWKELEFLVDSDAPATVVGKDQVKAVILGRLPPCRLRLMMRFLALASILKNCQFA